DEATQGKITRAGVYAVLVDEDGDVHARNSYGIEAVRAYEAQHDGSFKPDGEIQAAGPGPTTDADGTAETVVREAFDEARGTGGLTIEGARTMNPRDIPPAEALRTYKEAQGEDIAAKLRATDATAETPAGGPRPVTDGKGPADDSFAA